MEQPKSTCREKFISLFMFARKCAIFVGADVFNPNFRYTWMTWFVIISTNSFFVLSGYTIYVGVYIDKDWTAILQALCMVGSAVQGLAKLYSVTISKALYRQLYNEIDDVYKIYEQKHIQYQIALNNTTSINTKFVKFIACIYIFGTLILLSVPVLYLIIFGEKIFVMQFLIPGIDPKSDFGHLLMMVAHSTCILMGSFGNFAGDVFFFLFVLQLPLFKNILKIKFEDLNDVLNDTGEDSYEKTLPLLMDILKWHQKYTTLTKTLSDVFYYVLFVEIFTTALNIGMTIFIVATGVWPAGYAYLIYSFTILYTYCGLGTLTDIANDDVCNYVYNICLWYRLSVSERKMLMMMLMKAQKPTLMTVGDVMPLSVTTALSMTKTIYSFLMMLLNFSEE
ncbi:odorant receptor 67d-like [Episyrphus balteatus]|uniref:odorant receptor 67d-like n=1 Tax=Episyrphus balteatus TaxID=286459 RepID=UPI0024858187|nr:odorant receptor 67d-like [Episyrphus balteatus]